MDFTPLGDSAVVIGMGGASDADAFAAVNRLATRLRRAALKGVIDVVPAYHTLTVFYDPGVMTGDALSPYARLCSALEAEVLSSPSTEGSSPSSDLAADLGRTQEIPVCYSSVYAPDLGELAAHAGLSEADVIARHSRAAYRVEAIGFAPGFPYLSGLPAELAMPRRATPRARVETGSVGIGGSQTGVYPRPSPGGWRLIGRTPLRLFDLQREEPALLRVGDRVSFRPISEEEFLAWK